MWRLGKMSEFTQVHNFTHATKTITHHQMSLSLCLSGCASVNLAILSDQHSPLCLIELLHTNINGQEGLISEPGCSTRSINHSVCTYVRVCLQMFSTCLCSIVHTSGFLDSYKNTFPNRHVGSSK